MSNIHIRIISFSLLLVSIYLPINALNAQEEASANAFTIEEIIVTASKRKQSVRDLSFSVKGISGDYLNNIGANGFEDFALSTPSLDFNSTLPGQNRITMRGISALDGASTIGIYLDETPVTSAQESQLDANLYDLERVEVLRGPQGTLYGEGSIGGTIRLITNKPDLSTFSASINGVLSDTRRGDMNEEVDGVVNVPIVKDKLGLRVLAYHRTDEGYIENTALGKDDINAADTNGGRVSLRAKPMDRLTLDLSFNYTDLEVDGVPIVLEGAGYTQSRPLTEFTDDESKIVAFTLNYDFDSFQLTSNSSLFDREQATAAYLPVFGGLSNGITTDTEVFSQEIRLVSTTDSRFSWLVGGFYKDTDTSNTNPIDILLGTDILGPELALTDTDTENKQLAVFGELSYQLIERLKLTVGLRYYEEDNEATQLVSAALFLIPPTTFTVDQDVSVLIPRFGALLNVTDNVIAYANIGKGFRAGGVNANPLSPPGFARTYDEDSVWNYELGIKADLLERRLSTDIAVYHIDYSDYQSNILPAVIGGGVIDNVGDAHSIGLEGELSFRITPEFTFSVAGNWVESEIDEDVPGFGASDGNRLPLVPEYTVNVNVEYNKPDLFANFGGFVIANYSIVDDTYETLANFIENESYEIANLRLGIESKHYTVALFADNLFDEEYSNRNLGSGFGFFINRPRTLGVRFSARY